MDQRESDARGDRLARESEGWDLYCSECGEPLAICIGDHGEPVDPNPRR